MSEVGDNVFSLRLAMLPGDTEIIKGRRDTNRSHAESPHTQAKDYCEKQCAIRIVQPSWAHLGEKVQYRCCGISDT